MQHMHMDPLQVYYDLGIKELIPVLRYDLTCKPMNTPSEVLKKATKNENIKWLNIGEVYHVYNSLSEIIAK